MEARTKENAPIGHAARRVQHCSFASRRAPFRRRTHRGNLHCRDGIDTRLQLSHIERHRSDGFFNLLSRDVGLEAVPLGGGIAAGLGNRTNELLEGGCGFAGVGIKSR